MSTGKPVAVSTCYSCTTGGIFFALKFTFHEVCNRAEISYLIRQRRLFGTQPVIDHMSVCGVGFRWFCVVLQRCEVVGSVGFGSEG